MRLSWVILLVLIFSCHSPERPKDVLTHEQLSALLVDVYLAEARIEGIPKIRDTTIRYFMPFEDRLLKSRGISDTVMRVTYSYYMEHPKELETIYDVVIDTLNLRESKANRVPTASTNGVKPTVTPPLKMDQLKKHEEQRKILPQLKRPKKKLEPQ